MTSLDFRPVQVDLYIPATGGAEITVPVVGTNVVQASDWATVVRHKPSDAPTTVLASTITVDTTANSVTITFAQAAVAALIATGQAKWSGVWELQSTTLAGPIVNGNLVIDRSGSAPQATTTPTVTISGNSITATVTAAIPTNTLIPFTTANTGLEGRALIADPYGTNGVRMRYPSPKGPRAVVIGTSIEIGYGGDLTTIGSLSDLRPSNAAWFSHACASSNGKLRFIKNSGQTGDTIGGIGELMAAYTAGGTTLDIKFGDNGLGPILPYVTQTLYIDYHWTDPTYTSGLGPNFDTATVTAVATITGGVRVTLNTAMTKDHAAGTEIRWGMIGRFRDDVQRVAPDIVFIGAPSNDMPLINTGDLTATELAEGVHTLAKLVLGINAVPVLATVPARPFYADEKDEFNAKLRALAVTHGHWLLDFYRVTADPATRAFKGNLTADGTHPNQEGAMRMAQEVHDAFTDRVEIRHDSRRRASVDAYAFNCAGNGTFSSGSSGSGLTFLPTGWSQFNFFSTGHHQIAIVAPRLTDNIEGNLLQITADGSANGSWGVSKTVSITASGDLPAWATGDKLMLEAFVRLRGFDATGNNYAVVAATCTGSTGSVQIPVCYGWCRDFDGGVLTNIRTISSSIGTLTGIALQIYCVGQNNLGVGTLEVGEVSLFNVTAGDF